MRARSFLFVIVGAVVGLLGSVGDLQAQAQTFVPIRIGVGSFPTVQARLYGFTAGGAPAEVPSTLVVTENGTAVTTTVRCDPGGSTAGVNVSVLVAMDVSSSISQGNPAASDLMKNGARTISSLLTATSDEIGLLTIDANANLTYGLSTDKTAFPSVVDQVRPSGGMHLTSGLMSSPMGGLVHLQNARNQRALILYTDGATTFDLATSLGTARTFGIRVYVMGVRSALSADLRTLADSSGGAWVENITTVETAQAYSRAFAADAKRLLGCTVEWTSRNVCRSINDVSMTLGSVVRTTAYSVPAGIAPFLLPSSRGVSFGEPSAGNKVSRPLTITAVNGPITIIGATFSNPAFNITSPGTNFPISVPRGGSTTFILEYSASTPNGVYGTVTFSATTCEPLVIGLRGGSAFNGDVLRLTSPNGGEVYAAGDTTTIRWTNVLPEDIVRIELSSNAGQSWSTIAEGANGNAYVWRTGPATGSAMRVRVSRTVIDPDKIVVLRGQTTPLYSVTFTNDGSKVITGGDDGTVRVWDALTGAQDRLVGLHQNWVWSLDCMPNTTLVASASLDGSVRVWNYLTGERIATIPTDGQAYSVAFTPNGTALLIGTARSIMRVNTSTWNVTFTKNVDNGPVYDLDIAANGDVFAAAEGSSATVRSVSDLEERSTASLEGRTDKVYAVAIDANGTRFAAGGADFVVSMHDAADGRQVAAARPLVGAILGLDIAPDGSTVVAASGDGTAKIFDASTLALKSSLAGHAGMVYDATFSPDGRKVATASLDFTGRVWTIDGIGTTESSSATNFRVTGAEPVASTIDLGNVPLGSGADRVATAIRITGSDSLRILGASIVGGDANDFQILTTSLPSSITAASPLTLDVSFVPTQLGPRAADVDVVTGTGTERVRVIGNAVNPAIAGPGVIDFGRRVANQSVVDTIITLRAPASASGRIVINTTQLVGVQSNQFTIVDGGGSFSLSPGESRQVTLRFEPVDFGRFAGELVFEVSGQPTVRIRLYGEGTGDGRIAATPALLFPSVPCEATWQPQLITVRNFGNTPMQVYSAGMEGANAGEFRITAPSSYPIEIRPQESVVFTIDFTPAVNGPKEARVVITSSAVNTVNGRSTTQISARKDSVGYELSRPVVTFPNVNEGQEATERLLIINSGTIALRWPRQPVTVGRFRIESVTPEVTQPGQRSEFTVRFLGGVAGQVYEESYTFRDSVCGTTQDLRMRATVKSYIGATMRFGTVRADIGTTVNVPVYVTNKVNFDRTQATAIDAVITVDGTILTPAQGTPSGTLGADGYRTLTVTIPLRQTDSLATTIAFRTLWGRDTMSVIRIDSLILSDTLQITPVNGGVILDDICRQGGARLFELTTQAAGIRVAPMPATASTTAVVSAVEPGRTTVDLVDLQGRVVRAVADRVLTPGTWFIPLDLVTIPNGSYYLVMTTPSQRCIERIEVVR